MYYITYSKEEGIRKISPPLWFKWVATLVANYMKKQSKYIYVWIYWASK